MMVHVCTFREKKNFQDVDPAKVANEGDLVIFDYKATVDGKLPLLFFRLEGWHQHPTGNVGKACAPQDKGQKRNQTEKGKTLPPLLRPHFPEKEKRRIWEQPPNRSSVFEKLFKSCFL